MKFEYVIGGWTVVASWLDPSAAILRWSRDKTRSSSTSFSFFSFFFFPLHGPFLIIVITIGRPFAHALFSPSFIPLRASLPMPPLPSTYPPSSLAIEFGRANYIFSPLVEGIKLWYRYRARSPPASHRRNLKRALLSLSLSPLLRRKKKKKEMDKS